MWNIKFHSILALSASLPTPVEVQADGMYYTVKSQGPGAKYFNYDVSFMGISDESEANQIHVAEESAATRRRLFLSRDSDRACRR